MIWTLEAATAFQLLQILEEVFSLFFWRCKQLSTYNYLNIHRMNKPKGPQQSVKCYFQNCRYNKVCGKCMGCQVFHFRFDPRCSNKPKFWFQVEDSVAKEVLRERTEKHNAPIKYHLCEKHNDVLVQVRELLEEMDTKTE